MSSKIVQLAPMLGLIDAPFMNALVKIGGFDEMFAPYILADEKSLAHRGVLRHRFCNVDKSVILVPQLLSNSEVGFLHFANQLYNLGYKKVSWNMGCPQPFVIERNRGAAMLKNITTTASLIEAVLPKLQPQLSIKIRLGYTSCDEFYKLIEMFNRFEISELVVHARTAEQQYAGNVDKETFVEGAKLSRNRLVYNGDIYSTADIENLQLPNLKGFMIGRGAIANPFIGLQIKGKCIGNQAEKFKTFCLDIQNWYLSHGGRGSVNRMKELWKYFSKSFVSENQVFNELLPITNSADFASAVNRIFDTYQLKFS